MSHPMSYTAYAFTKKGGKLERITVDWKDPKENEVVIKVLACGVCGSDKIVQKQRQPTGLPRIPGHEIVGNIVAVSPSEKQYNVGERVGSGWHGGHCSKCRNCRAGDPAVCENQDVNGIMRDGGYAEYVTLRTEALVKIPGDMDPAEAAPLLCAGVTTFNSLRHMDCMPGDIVAVQGIGGLGHLAIQFARAMGYRVVALSHSESKHDLAEELGAMEYIDGSKVDQAEALQKLGGAKVIMCTAPKAEIMQGLIGGLSIGGQLLILALPEDESTVKLDSLITKRLSIRGWPSGAAKDSEETIEFAKNMGVHCMVEKYPLDKAQEAYEHREQARFRTVIIP